ncbi:MAG TPA: TIGR03435 family protein [Vicinamibacterales bacterium]|nr:TIGR03435 family protein [Vicinamibacterales bacterium]
MTVSRIRSVGITSAMLAILTTLPVSGATQERPTPPGVSFDVASVRPSPPGPDAFSPVRIRVQPGGRFNATGAVLEELIRFAYAMESYEAVSGKASGLLKQKFDINATSDREDVREASSRATGPMRTMLQNLLAQRFRLRVRWEEREQAALVLVRSRADGKLGPGLRSSSLDCADPESRKGRTPVQGDCQISWIDGRVKANGQRMPAFANFLSRLLRRPVFDRTNLNGPFDIDMVSSSEGIPPPGGSFSRASIDEPVASSAPALATALKEQLGVALESRMAPIRALVIENVQEPTDN